MSTSILPPRRWIPPQRALRDTVGGGENRQNVIQHFRTGTPDNPPPNHLLLDGELGIEQATPLRVWVGVQPSLDPTGRKLLFDASLIGEGGGSGEFLPLTGGTITGPLTVQTMPQNWIGSGGYHLMTVGASTDTSVGIKFLTSDVTTPAFAILRYSDGLWISSGTETSWRDDIAQFRAVGVRIYKPLDLSSTLSVNLDATFLKNATATTPPTMGGHLTNKTYVDQMDALLQQEIDVLSEDMFFCGGLNVVTDIGHYTIASGITDATPLPAPGPTYKGFYVIVTQGGVAKAGHIPPATYALGDWIACDGIQWIRLPLGQADIIAQQVAITPPIGLLGPNVHTGLQWLDTGKVNLSGGTMTGMFTLWADPINAMDATPKQYVDDRIYAVAGGYLPLTGGLMSGAISLGASASIISPAVATGAGLPINIIGGTTSEPTANVGGGGINITAGRGRSAAHIRITAGIANNFDGGALYLTGGRSMAIAGGNVYITSGTGVTKGGNVSISFGNAGTPQQGNLSIINLRTTSDTSWDNNVVWNHNGVLSIGAGAPPVDLSGYLPLTGGALSGPLSVTNTLDVVSTTGAASLFVKGASGYPYISIGTTSGVQMKWLNGAFVWYGADANGINTGNTWLEAHAGQFYMKLPFQASSTVTLAADPTVALHAATKQYVDRKDDALQMQIDVLAEDLFFIGGINVVTDVGNYTIASGITQGIALPAPVAAYKGFFLIVTQGGQAKAGHIPPGVYSLADWIVCNGSQWVHLPIGQADMIAQDVELVPPIGGATNVQAGLQWLYDNKVARAGDTMTGFLTLHAPPTAPLHAATKAYADTLSPVGKYLLLTGGALSGSLTLGSSTAVVGLYMQGPKDADRFIHFQSAGIGRWQVGVNRDPESTGNAGSNFAFHRYADDGAWLGHSLYFNRATGLGVVIGDPTAALGIATKQYVDTQVVTGGGAYLPLTGGTVVGPLTVKGMPNNWGGYSMVTVGSLTDITPGIKFVNVNTITQAIGIERWGSQLYVSYGTETSWTGDIAYFSANLTAFLKPVSISGTMTVSGDATFNRAVTAVTPPTSGGHLTNKTYVDQADTALQTQIDVLAEDMFFIGGMNVVTDVGHYTIASGIVDGSPLPAPSLAHKGFYVIVTQGGAAKAGHIPPGVYSLADWIACDGAQWVHLPLGQAKVIAQDVEVVPQIGVMTPANVQANLQWLYSNKLDQTATDARYLKLTGGIMTGGISFGALVGASISDLSKHLLLHNNGYGVAVSSGRLNIVGGAGSTVGVVIGAADVVHFNTAGMSIVGATQTVTLTMNPTAAMHAVPKQFLDSEILAKAGVVSFNTRKGAVVLTLADVTGVGGAPINAPLFTGDARAVTPAAADNDTSIATTAFVKVQGYATTSYVNAGDNALQVQIDVLAEDMFFAGGINVVTDICHFTIASALPDGTALPAPGVPLKGFYVIVTQGGTAKAGHIPAGNYVPGDWIACDGIAWIKLPLGQANVVASQVAISPAIGPLGANVQTGLQWLYSNKLDTTAADTKYLKLTGGAVTGVTSFTPSISVTNGNSRLSLSPGLGGGSYNPLLQTGDAALIGDAWAVNTGALTLMPWSSSALGIRMDNVAKTIVLTATGAITVSADPTAAMGIATKQYVDAKVSTGVGAYLPLTGGSLSGGLNVNGTLQVGSPTLQQVFQLNGPVNSARDIRWATAGSLRWLIRLNTQAEATGDTGANIDFISYTNAGAVLKNPVVRFNRTGVAAFYGGVTINTLGLSFPGGAVTSHIDLSKHISLFGNVYGFSVSASRLNYVVPANASHLFVVNSVDTVTINSGGLIMGANKPLTLGMNPTAPMHATPMQYVDAADQALQREIDVLAEDMFFAGGINVVTDVCHTTIASGLVNGIALPAPGASLKGFYFIVTNPGQSKAGHIPSAIYALADWIACDGVAWIQLPLGQANIIASQVAITPAIGSLGANVQTGLSWLNTNKFNITGGTVSGVSTFQSTLNVYGNVVMGTAAGGNLTLYMQAAAGTTRYIQWRSGAVARWIMGADSAAESSPSTGSNWGLFRYANDGSYLGSPLGFNRSTGLGVVSGDPTAALGIATKQYADTKLTQATADGRYLKLAGGTLTGFLTLHAPPTAALHAATKAYVDSAAAGGGSGVYLPIAGGTMTGTLHAKVLNVNGLFYTYANQGNVVPTPGAGIYLSWNYSGGGREANIWAGDNLAATAAFRFHHITGVGTQKNLIDIEVTGALKLYGHGVTYNGIVGGGNYIGFTWASPNVSVWVDGANQGPIATQSWSDTRYVNATGDSMSGGLKFGSVSVTVPNDFSKHIELFGGWGGFTIMSSRLNIVSGGATYLSIGATDTAYFNGSGLTILGARHVTLGADPTATMHATPKQYVDAADQALQREIDVLAEDMFFAGGINIVTDVCHTTIASGLVNGIALPAPGATLKGFYFIVTQAGVAKAGHIPPGVYALADWIACDGIAWIQLPLGQANIIASQVAISPAIGALGANVQTGLQYLETNKLTQAAADTRYVNTAGDTMTGHFQVGTATATAGIYINGPAASIRAINFRTALVMRWQLRADATAEAEPQTGSDLVLTRYNNAGGGLGTALAFSRATGLGTVGADPTAPLGIATKQYVDGKVTSGTAAYLPLAGGTMTGGILFGSRTGTGPDDVSKHLALWGTGLGIGITGARQNYVVDVNSSHWFRVGGADKVQIGSGGMTMHSPLTLQTDPTAVLHAATKQYVDAKVATGGAFLPLAGGTMTGKLWITLAATATTEHLFLRPTNIAAQETKLRFGGTFTGASGEYGARLTTSLRSGMTGSWGTEYLDVWVNHAPNDATSDATQSRIIRFQNALVTVDKPTTFSAATTLVGASSFRNGISFNNAVADVPTNLDKHIKLYNGYGMSVTGNTLNIVGGPNIDFHPGGVHVVKMTGTGLAMIGNTRTVTLTMNPTANLHATPKQYVDAATSALQVQIDVLANDMFFAGGINVVTDVCHCTIASGLVDGIALPAPSAALKGFYFIVTNPGAAKAGNIPAGTYALADWIACDGVAWIQLPLGQANIIASQVAISPAIGSLGANVQTGLSWLNTNKLNTAGGTVTGTLFVGTSTAAVNFVINGQAASNRLVNIRTANIQRWVVGGNATAESTGNVGTDFLINAYNDAGAFLHTAVLFSRATGLGTVKGDPTAALGIATKQYADLKMTQATADGRYLKLAGGTLTGFLLLHADPTAAMHAATKQYVDAQAMTQAESDARYVNVTGDTMTGALSVHATLNVGNSTTAQIITINGPINTNRDIRFYANTQNRWLLRMNAIAEGAGNVGASFDWITYDNAGAVIKNPAIRFERTGLARFYTGIVVTGGHAEAASLRATGSFAIPGQGAHMMWNRVGGSGSQFFVNHRGGGYGGFTFIDTDGTTDLTLLDLDRTSATFSTTVGGWGAANYGKQIIVQGAGTNPTIGIADSAATNYIALTNAAGKLVISKMGLLTATTGQVNMVTVDSVGTTFQTGGVSFGNQVGATAVDLSKHIRLYAGTYGFSVTGGTMNIVSGGTLALYPAAAARVAYFNSTGMGLDANMNMVLGKDPTAALHAATKQYVDNHATSTVYVKKTGDTMTGGLTVLSSLTLGPIPSGYSTIFMYCPTNMGNSIDCRVNGQARWALHLCDGTLETGVGDIGSNFSLEFFGTFGRRYVMTVERATGSLTMLGAVHAKLGCSFNGADDFYAAESGGYRAIQWEGGSQPANEYYHPATKRRGWALLGTGDQMSLDSIGNLWIAAAFSMNGLLYNTGTIDTLGNCFVGEGLYPSYTRAKSFVIYNSGTNVNVIQMQTDWLWYFNCVNGDMHWIGAGAGSMWLMGYNTTYGWLSHNPIGPVGGVGAFVVISDERTKRDIVPATVGLAEILALEPISFTRISLAKPVADPKYNLAMPRSEIGFSAQQVRRVIPQAVGEMGTVLPDGTGGFDDDEPTLGMTIDPIVVALVNSVKELVARNEALSARIATLEARTLH